MQKLPFTTDILDRVIELYGDDIGVVTGDGHKFTYAELGERINRLSNALRERNIEKSDRVALPSSTSHYFMDPSMHQCS